MHMNKRTVAGDWCSRKNSPSLIIPLGCHGWSAINVTYNLAHCFNGYRSFAFSVPLPQCSMFAHFWHASAFFVRYASQTHLYDQPYQLHSLPGIVYAIYLPQKYTHFSYYITEKVITWQCRRKQRLCYVANRVENVCLCVWPGSMSVCILHCMAFDIKREEWSAGRYKRHKYNTRNVLECTSGIFLRREDLSALYFVITHISSVNVCDNLW